MSDAHRLLMIRASAGAGKTYALSLRYLRLIALGHSAGSILATTFTRAAAGEIGKRVLERLAHAARDDAAAKMLAREIHADEFDRRAFTRLLRRTCDEIDRLTISTIDSFFSRIASGFRHELGVPAAVTMVGSDDPIARELRLEAIETLLGASDPQVLIDLLRRLHHGDATRSVTDAIDRIVGDLYDVYLDAPDVALWSKLRAVGELDPSGLAQAIDQLRGIGDVLAGNNRMATAWQKDVESATKRQWETFISTGLAGKIASEDTPAYYRKPIPLEVIDAYEPLVAHAAASQIGTLSRATLATHELLEAFHTHYEALRRRRRVMLFSDPPRMLADHFDQCDDTLMNEVYYRLDGVVDHLMLDEFQDTSLSQWRVLAPLAGEICLAEDPGRSFFCVGDTKQAIYGWRGGCAEVFDLVEEAMCLPAESVVRADINYRSASVVLDCVRDVVASFDDNEALVEVHDTAMRWAAQFRAHTAKRDLPGYIELSSSPVPPPETPEVDDGEGAGAGAGAGGYASCDEGDPSDNETGEVWVELRPHDYFVAEKVRQIAKQSPGSSIGVLVTRRALVQPLVHLIGERVRDMGLTVSGEAGNALTDDPAVLAVLAAMTLADHPGDRMARFQVERSPLAKVVGLETQHDGEGDGQIDKKIDSQIDRQIDAWALRVRAALLERGYAAVIQGWVKKLASIGACNRRNLVRLAQLVDLAEKYDAGASLRPGRFVKFVEGTPVHEPTPAPIRVMTIHRSKGLEFDAVVLPQLDTRLGEVQRSPAYVYRPQPTEPVAAVYRATNEATRAQADELEKAYQQERERRLQDDFSALYVAMTRARMGLYMVVPPLKATTKGEVRTHGWTNLTYAAILRQALSTLGESEGFDGDKVLYHAGEADWWRRSGKQTGARMAAQVGAKSSTTPASSLTIGAAGLSLNVSERRRSWAAVTPSSLAGGGVMDMAQLLRSGDSHAARRGRILHAMFQEVAWLDIDGEPTDEAIELAVRRAVVDVTEHELQERLTEFRRMLTQPVVRACLSQIGQMDDNSASPSLSTSLWREMPFAARIEDQSGGKPADKLVRGVFDRVVIRRRGGKAVGAQVIDFKTDEVDAGNTEGATVATGATGATRLAEHVQRYSPQLRAYRQVLAGMLGLDAAHVQAILIFVNPDVKVIVD